MINSQLLFLYDCRIFANYHNMAREYYFIEGETLDLEHFIEKDNNLLDVFHSDFTIYNLPKNLVKII